MTEQDAQRDHLARRLEDGWQRISDAERSGNYDTLHWTDFWAALLHQYEELVDEIEEAAAALEQGKLV